MAITSNEKQKVKTVISDYLSSDKSSTRKEIMDAVLDAFGFFDKEKQSKSSNSKCNNIRSYAGSVLSEMCSNGDIKNENGNYVLIKERAVIVEEDQCRNAILAFLKKKPYTKKDLYATLQKHFKTDKTKTVADDNALKGLAGNLLSSLINTKKILLEDGKYSLPVQIEKKVYPKQAVAEETFEKIFLERLCDCGGDFFERFVSNLLEKYFIITGRDVLNCEVIGGTNDGGIDVVIDTIEELGFTEQIMVQAKCRKNIQITEKEVREFYGALNAKGGSRGIFITTSTFHPCAEKLLLSINNCVGINGSKMFGLVKQTAYGIRKNKDGYLFDETIFNN
ncbi:MAG: restriction endonuclease [Clostridiales bacterium]|nr:restriction endonuclease [Clostridiales bacterium]